MDIVHLSSLLGLFVLKAAGILVIIYGPMIIGARWLPRIDNRGLYLQPVAWLLPLLSGAIVGAGLLYSNLDPEYFTVNAIFQTEGPWGLSYTAFLGERVNPLNYSFEVLFDRMVNPGENGNLMAMALVAVGCFAALVVRCVTLWRSAGALRGILYGTVVAIWACYMTIFAAGLTLWLLNQLNFWTLAVVTILVHMHRSHNFPVHLSTIMAPVANALQPGHGHGGHGHHGGGNRRGGHGAGAGQHQPSREYEGGGRLPHEREHDEDEVEIPASLTQSVP